MNKMTREETLTREILEAVNAEKNVTQRGLANQLGVALGLANSYLKRCVRKGLIKIEQAPANRYLYYLTPHGFAEKSRLTAEYLSSSFDFYRRASADLNKLYLECEERHIQKLILCGKSELAEIAMLRSQEHNIEITGCYDEDFPKGEFLGVTVRNRLKDLPESDGFVITNLSSPAKTYEHLHAIVDPTLIFIPELLDINIRRNKEI